MFMKAILYNKEDDLHFLLKCLVEKIEDDLLLKQEDDDDFFNPKSRADDKLEDSVFGETSLQDMVEEDAMKESDFGDIKEGKSDDKVKAKVMNKLSTGFYADVKRAIETEQKKSPTPLTRQQKEKITFDLREKAYKKFISEGKPLEIKLKNTSYKWTVDEIKDTWKEFTADRDSELRRQQYVKDKAELKNAKRFLDSFDDDAKLLDRAREYAQKTKMDLLSSMLVSERIGNVYDVIDESDENIELFNYYKKKLGDAAFRFNAGNVALLREERRGMYRKHPKGTPARKIVDEYFTKRTELTNKITALNRESLVLFGKFKKDPKKLEEEAEKLDNKIKEATEKVKELDKNIDKNLPKDEKGKPMWAAEYKLTDKEKKEYQDRIKELETKTKEDEKFLKETQRDSVKVSPIQVMQADKDLAGVAKKLKQLLENQAVKDYLKGKKNPLEGKELTAYMKGSYSDAKLRAFLETDAKSKGIRDKARGKRIPLGDGAGVRKEAYRRIYNYIQFLTKKVKEKSKKGTVKRAVKRIQDDLKEHNDKLFRDLDSQQRKRFGAASKYTRAAYSTLARSLKNMKEISDRQDTSDNKRMLEAKKVLENEKYGMTLMRDLMNIALGQKLEKPPKKQRKDSKGRSQESAITRKIKALREKISESDKEFKTLEEKLKEGKRLTNEETTKYLDFKKDREDLPNKIKELTTKLRGKISDSTKDGGSVEGTPASLREQQKERQRKRGITPKRKPSKRTPYEQFRSKVLYGAMSAKRSAVKENPKFVERYLKENPDDKEYIGELKKAEDVGGKTGLNAFRFFDVNMVGKTYVLEERESALNTKDPNYADIEKFANQIKDILSDKKIMSAIEKTYSKLTGGTVFGQDKRSAEKRKQISTALESLKPFISQRRKVKKLLKPIPDFLVKEMIQDETKLSENFMLFLKVFERMQIVDVSNILVDNNKLVSDKNKVKGIGGSPYYNIFNKPIAVPISPILFDEEEQTLTVFSNPEGDKDFQDKIIQATKDEYSDNSNSFLRDYWNVVIERLKKDIQEIGGVEEDEKGIKEVFMYDYSIEELAVNTEKYYKTISNPTSRKKKAFDEFFLALDKKQDGKAFFKEIEDLIKSIVKLQKEYRTKNPSYEPAKELSKLDINKVAEDYSKKALKALDKLLDDYGYVSGEGLNLKIARKQFRYVFPIPISTDVGEKIIMGALRPIAKQKNVDTVAELLDMEMENDSILIEALKNSFLNYFKQNEEKIKQIIETEKGKSEIEQASLEQLKDEFEDLIKTFKSKKTVIDMSKVDFDINDANLKEILTNAQFGKDLAKILETDLTDVYDSYVKRLARIEEIHEQNMKNAEKISQSFAPKTKEQAKREAEQIQTIPKEQGDEEE